MNRLLVLPILVPLAAATLCLLAHRRFRVQRIISAAGAGGVLIAGLILLAQVRAHGPVATRIGNWPAPFAITLAADLLSAIMIALAGFVAVAVTIFSLAGVGLRRERFGHHVLVQTLLMGVNGAYLTADLFNMYVWFEIFLLSSYVLLVLEGGRAPLSGPIKYVVLNLLSSVLFLSAIGLLYGLTGTLNLADLSRAVPLAGRPGLVAVVAVLFFVAFGIKAAVFPLFSWLPAAYPAAPPAVLALFSGLLTKTGVYAILRIFTLVFPVEGSFIRPLLLWIAGLTMVTGVLGAVAQGDIRRLLSFHIVSQIGYLLFGAALATGAALGGAIYFFMHVIVAKAGLFLAGGIVERLRGTGELKRLGGLHRTRPMLSILFLLCALALAGLPPLSGFWGKLLLLQAGLAERAYGLVGVGLAVSALTLYSMMKIWAEAFWKEPPAGAGRDGRPERPGSVNAGARDEAGAPPERALSAGARVALYAPLALCALFVLALGIAAGPVSALAAQAGRDLVSPAAYIRVVLGAQP